MGLLWRIKSWGSQIKRLIGIEINIQIKRAIHFGSTLILEVSLDTVPGTGRATVTPRKERG